MRKTLSLFFKVLCVFGLLLFAVGEINAQKKILFLSDDTNDDFQMEFLINQGFEVTKFWVEGGISTWGADTIAMLNAADLIICGRSLNSGEFDDPDKAVWHSLTAPLILNSMWASRSSRVNFFNSTSAGNLFLEATSAEAVIPSDDIFSYASLDADDMLGWFNYGIETNYLIDTALAKNNGTVVVGIGDTIPLLVRWDAETEFYPGAGESAKGPRVYFGFGAEPDQANHFPLTRDAKQVYLAEVCRLMEIPLQEAEFETSEYKVVFLSDDTNDDLQLEFLINQGLEVTKFWAEGGISTWAADTIAMLNAADLIICGRSLNSGEFDDPDKAVWHSLTTPLIMNSMWSVRSSRVNFFNSTSAGGIFAKATGAEAVIPSDEILSLVDLDADNMLGWFNSGIETNFLTDTALAKNNGTVVIGIGDTIPLLVRWDAETEFYPGAGDSAKGPRVYFGFGAEPDQANHFPLTRDAKQVYLAEVCRLLDIPVIEAEFETSEYKVVFLSDDENDDLQLEFLMNQGFEVTKFWVEGGISTWAADTIAMLNAADLIVCGRSLNSGEFDDPDKAVWHSLTTPLIMNSMWSVRSSRVNFFNSTSAGGLFAKATSVEAVIPSDEVLSFVDLDADNMLGWFSAGIETNFLTDTALAKNNGTVVFGIGDTIPLLVRWDAETEFYPGAGDSAKGPRVYFGFGAEPDQANHFPLTNVAKQVYFNEISQLLGLPLKEVVLKTKDFSILFLSDDENDDLNMEYLIKQGFDVTKFWTEGGISTWGADTIAMMNASDLIICGRSLNSGEFDDPDKAVWHSLTAPLIMNSMWGSRSSRINFFNSVSTANIFTGSTNAEAVIPSDEIFTNVILGADLTVEWFADGTETSYMIDTALYANNGTLVVGIGDTIPLVVRWDTETEFYPNAGDSAMGPRVYFGFGTEPDQINHFPLSNEAKQVYFNEISRILGLPMMEAEYPSNDATLSDLMIDGTTVNGYTPTSYIYDVELAQGTTTAPDVTATTNDESATYVVTPAGGLPGSATVLVRAEDGMEQLYTINFTVDATGILSKTMAQISIYPNPANTTLNVTNVENSVLSIYGLNGSLLRSINSSSNTATFDLSEMVQGVYILKIQKSGELRYMKFIKE